MSVCLMGDLTEISTLTYFVMKCIYSIIKTLVSALKIWLAKFELKRMVHLLKLIELGN